MNTETISIRLTAAASAAILAVTFAGCANADTTGEPDTRTSIVDAGQGAVRFVPSDNDPRGHHVVRESVPTEARSVPSDNDPRGKHGLAWWEIAQLQQRLHLLER
jgi:hypothetical protein